MSAHEVSRRLLHRLMASTNRRMHKGFPEMLSYLLRKPMEYCSHRFVSFSIEGKLRHAILCVHNRLGKIGVAGEQMCPSQPMALREQAELRAADYAFRPAALHNFPLYFFMAGCVAHSHLNSESMRWQEICSRSRDAKSEAIWPRQRSYHTEPLESKIFPGETLVDKDGKPLHKYGYYVRLLTHTAWRVPLLFGRLPTAPAPDAPAYERGIFGLCLMVLFRAVPFTLCGLFGVHVRCSVFRISKRCLHGTVHLGVFGHYLVRIWETFWCLLGLV